MNGVARTLTEWADNRDLVALFAESAYGAHVVDAATAQHACSLVAQNPLLQNETAAWLVDCGAHEQQSGAQSSKAEQASPSSFVPLPPVMSNVGHFPLDETALCGPLASGGPPMHVYALVPCPFDAHPTIAIATSAFFMLAS